MKQHDKFKWLENEDQEVFDWELEQSGRVDSFFKKTRQAYIENEIEEYFDTTFYTAPKRKSNISFYMKKPKGLEKSSLFMASEIDAIDEVCIFDASKRIEKIIGFSVSPESSYVVLWCVKDQTEMGELYIYDVKNHLFLQDIITHCRYPSVSWLPDEQSFFYTGHPKNSDDFYNQKIYLHCLGKDEREDECIFGEGFSSRYIFTPKINKAGTKLLITGFEDLGTNNAWYFDIVSRSYYELFPGENASFSGFFSESSLYVITQKDSENKKVLHSFQDKVSPNLEDWDLYLPEHQEYKIKSLHAVRDYILIHYTNYFGESFLFYKNVYPQSLGNDSLIKIDLPYENCSVHSIETERDTSNNFYYESMSWIEPKSIFLYSHEKNENSLIAKQEGYMESLDFIVTKTKAPSLDGEVSIPLTIIHSRTQQEPRPCILNVYGGFQSSRDPHFLRSYIYWFSKGYSVVFAHVRGGGEKGISWHTSAVGPINKRKTFDDVFSCAQFLISQNYTTRSMLGLMGGSNGGLSVLATVMLYPNICGAIFADCPVVDMLRFHLGGIGLRWKKEYGNPDIPSDAEHITTWSPYHLYKQDVTYPPIAISFGDEDTRIPLYHGRKMIALLQQNSQNTALYILHKGSGHVGSINSKQRNKKIAETLAFFEYFLIQEK